jgi:hypothetical protein
LTGDVGEDEGLLGDAHRDQAVHVQSMRVCRAEEDFVGGDDVIVAGGDILKES